MSAHQIEKKALRVTAMNPTLGRFLVTMMLGGTALIATGCGPTYPKCENDGHCREKGEYCLNGTCQECRDNSHCEGPGMMCAAGKCQRQPGYCDENVACPGNQKCRDNQCGPPCLDNSECEAKEYCDGSGNCVPKPECGPNADNPNCPEGQECVGGTCQIKAAQCTAEPVYFDFDRSNVKSNQRSKLDQVAACMQDPNAATVVLEGHADERGTEEYNLALSERRAQAARSYLVNKGVPSGKLETVGYGEARPAVDGSNERAWGKNRRVEFNPR